VIINRAVNQLPNNQSFVNVSVWNGFSFLAGLLNNPEKICIGIDNFSERGVRRIEFLKRIKKMISRNHYFYNMDYQKYFSDIQNGQIGFFMMAVTIITIS
jgi:hypothetical protein